MTLQRVARRFLTLLMSLALGAPAALAGGAPATVIVRPGESIQAAVDAAAPGTTIVVMPGTYQESPDTRSGALTISKDGIRLIGASVGNAKVVLENAGNQVNGIQVVPPNETECQECHVDLADAVRRRAQCAVDLECPGTPAVAEEQHVYGFELRGFTVKGFVNGVFTRRVEGFRIVHTDSIDNDQYGIFPTLSSHGVVANSYATGSNDSGIWVETSERVLVMNNLVEDSVNGFEISNSEDIELIQNEARHNTAGIAHLLLPFLERKESKRILLSRNWIHDNNRENTATPGTILREVPKGTGILALGVDETLIERNIVENNGFVGIAIADYCAAVAASPFSCDLDPDGNATNIDIDPDPEHNRVERNQILNNGFEPPLGILGLFAADIAYLLFPGGGEGNCFTRNLFETTFPADGVPPCL